MVNLGTFLVFFKGFFGLKLARYAFKKEEDDAEDRKMVRFGGICRIFGIFVRVNGSLRC